MAIYSTTRGRGRPPRATPDTRTASEKRREYLAKRHVKAVESAACLDLMPAQARIKQAALEILTGKSHATIWRDVRSGRLPAPHKDGRSSYWLASEVRAILQPATAQVAA